MTSKKLVMFVFGDITTDARVQRAANALHKDFNVLLLSNDNGKIVDDVGYKNLLLKGCPSIPLLNSIVTVWQAFRIIKHEKPDVVYAHDYFSAMLVRLLLNRKYCQKLVYDAHELIIPEQTVKSSIRQSFFYEQEKRIIKKVDLVICANDERGKLMKDHYGLEESPFVVPNISQLIVNDNDSDVKAILDSLRAFFSIPKPTVVYAGVVSKSRNIGKLVDATISLYDRCKLLIMGTGDDIEALRERASKHPELISAFTGSVNYKCLGSILSRCDIGFLYYPIDTLNNKYCASNKIYEYASVGLPMLANENPTVKKTLDEFHIGISTEDFGKGLISLISDRDSFKKNCKLFTQERPWDKEVIRLKNVVSFIAETHSA